MSILSIDGSGRRIWFPFKLLGDFPGRTDFRYDHIAVATRCRRDSTTRLSQAPEAYTKFQKKQDGFANVVLQP